VRCNRRRGRLNAGGTSAGRGIALRLHKCVGRIEGHRSVQALSAFLIRRDDMGFGVEVPSSAPFDLGHFKFTRLACRASERAGAR
jgi:hypothetical protein